MVDIHSHILFGVDDGSSSIEESIILIEQAIQIGYTDIVCSSHYEINKYENQNYEKNFDLLQKEIQKKNINIKIYKGNELALTDGDFNSHKENIHTINKGKYLLIELKQKLIFPVCKNFFKSLISQGIVPIFAHIERYTHFSLEELIELYDMGVILQVNIIAAANPSPKIKYLLKNKYIGVLASDAHKAERRNYKLINFFNQLKKELDDEYFKKITEINPRKIINNENIDIWRVDKNEFKKSITNNGFFSALWSNLFKRFSKFR